MLRAMDDIAIGRLLRSIRVRLGRRQVDVAEAAGMSQQLVSLLEAGRLDRLSVRALRRIAAALDAEIVISVRWRGAEVDRLRDEDHARVVAAVVRLLEANGWLTATEITFSHFGERGSIDVLAFHAATGTLLVIEVKTEIASVEETLRRLDVKARLGGRIAAERLGWRSTRTARLLAVLDTRTSRRRVERHDEVLGRSFPLRGWAARSWLSSPALAPGLLLFLTPTTRGGAKRGPATTKRVRRRPPSVD
jgi:transcriptional regulator with XRE-family HTH domain